MDRPAPPPNVDKAEIAKFEATDSFWWDPSGEQKALHDINGLRLGYIIARVPLKRRQVLDVGCGGGILSEAMAAMGARVTGIDAGQAPLTVAQRHLASSDLSVEYQLTTAEEFALRAPQRFDVVVCMELLEHVPRPSSVVAACADLVRHGGDVFFATLNRNLKSFLFAIVGAEYLLKLVRRGTHSYHKFVKPAELERWARDAGLRREDITGLHYNPFTRRYSLGGNHHVNYLMHLKK
jgi:2-polyprenyl-6-hydroxyphenyl methylase / 3-demethylubiquinone-9 3-methyltransferase